MSCKIYIIASLIIAIIPYFRNEISMNQVEHIPWPKTILDEEIIQTPLSEQDKIFLAYFPGKVARFKSTNKEYILRYVTRPSRKLHSSALCLSSNAAEISYLPLWKDSKGRLWSQFNAKWRGKKLLIKEIIIDKTQHSFTDASSWYWQAIFNKSEGPWLSITQIDTIQGPEENE